MARLEWEYRQWKDWLAYSSFPEPNGFAQVWIICVSPDGRFTPFSSPAALIHTKNTFTTLAEAQAWCQQQEDELCQKT